MPQKITTFLMFEGKAAEAMNFYVSLFPDSKIVDITRYEAEAPNTEGSVMHATVSLAGQQFIILDSAVKHPFGFTPAMSLFVDCQNEAEIDALAAKLGEGGQTLMPLDAYPFARRYTWLIDRFGVSWQLGLK